LSCEEHNNTQELRKFPDSQGSHLSFYVRKSQWRALQNALELIEKRNGNGAADAGSEGSPSTESRHTVLQ